MKNLSKKSKIKGSATLVVIIASVVFMLYAQSTRADAKHMANMHEKYKESILKEYNEEYTEKVNELNI